MDGPRTSWLQLVDERLVAGLARVAERDLPEGNLDADEPEGQLCVEHAEGVSVVHLATCSVERDDDVARRIEKLGLVAVDLDRLDEGEAVADPRLDDGLDEFGAFACRHGLHQDGTVVTRVGLDVATQVRVELVHEVTEVRQVLAGAGATSQAVELLEEQFDGMAFGPEAVVRGRLDQVDACMGDVVGDVGLHAEHRVDPATDAFDSSTEQGNHAHFLVGIGVKPVVYYSIKP